jgi:uncharacterized protein (UPF0261 family)
MTANPASALVSGSIEPFPCIIGDDILNRLYRRGYRCGVLHGFGQGGQAIELAAIYEKFRASP